ncbi:MAG: type 4a pilus biogenesis protein PilO [Candidatus Omnitrophica bacterium]|nr:type 4a pilus biogenesis protein PilO [Candidatus Omnitrophota bacterium]
MKKLKNSETVILIIAVVLFICFLVMQFIIKPIREGDVDINDRLRVSKTRLIKEQQTAAQKSLVESRYENLVNLVGVDDSEEAQMTVIVSKIENSAHESNVHIANIRPLPSVKEKEAVFLKVELELDGQWLDIVHFLNLLQAQPNFYFINDLNLEKSAEGSSVLRGDIVVSRMCLVH